MRKSSSLDGYGAYARTPTYLSRVTSAPVKLTFVSSLLPNFVLKPHGAGPDCDDDDDDDDEYDDDYDDDLVSA